MKLVHHRSTSPRIILNQPSPPSSNNLQNPQKQKILVIILNDDESQEFEEFCLQIYNQSIYLAHKNVTPILLCETYSQYQAIEKDPKTDFYILCSQKTIDQPNLNKKQRESWVVFDSGSKVSRKKILDMPNVVYCTKQLESLRNKLESRNFIPKQTLINEKYRRIYQKNQRKVQNLLITPIQECINESKLSINQHLLKSQTEKPPSLIEALKSQSFNEAQIILNSQRMERNILSREELSNYSPRMKSNLKKQNNFQQGPAEIFSPSTSQSSKQMNFMPQMINDYIQQSRPQGFQIQSSKNDEKKRKSRIIQNKKLVSQEYSNSYVGPGSNRIIDLTDYEKFNQNGIFVYRKKTPQKYYFRPSQDIDRKLSAQTPNHYAVRNLSPNENSQYCIQKNTLFDPQNATYDYARQNNLRLEPNKIKKPYRTCDSDFYNFDSNPQKLSTHNVQKDAKIHQNKIFQSKQNENNRKRTSDQMKEYLDSISSLQNYNNDYQVQPIKNNLKIIEKFSKNLNDSQASHKPPLPAYSQSQARKLIRRERPKSMSKVNSLTNRFVGSDSFHQNSHQNFYNSDFPPNSLQISIHDAQCLQPKEAKKLMSKSVPSRGPHRPLLRSAQKRQQKLDLGNSKRITPKQQQHIGPSNISQKTKGQKSSTVESYLVYEPVDGNVEKSNKPRLLNKNCQSLTQKFSLSSGKQQVSVLYLVDHLINQSFFSDLQEIITANDSVYRWKHLSQLSNQVRQSVQVYDLVFVFKEQLVSDQELQVFFSINPQCYVVDVNPKNAGIEIYTNKVKMRRMRQFQNALRIILQRKFPIRMVATR